MTINNKSDLKMKSAYIKYNWGAMKVSYHKEQGLCVISNGLEGSKNKHSCAPTFEEALDGAVLSIAKGKAEARRKKKEKEVANLSLSQVKFRVRSARRQACHSSHMENPQVAMAGGAQ